MSAFESNANDLGSRYSALQQNRQELLDRIGALSETLKKREQQIGEQRIEYARAATLAQSEMLELTTNLQKVRMCLYVCICVCVWHILTSS